MNLPEPSRKRIAEPTKLGDLLGGKADDYDAILRRSGLPTTEQGERRQVERLSQALRSGALRQGKLYSRSQVEAFADRFGLDPERDFSAEDVDLDRMDYQAGLALLSAAQQQARATGDPQTGRTLRYVTAYRLSPTFTPPSV